MSSLLNVYFKVEQLEVILKTLKAKNEKGISLDLSISEDSNGYGQNVSAYVSQTKEEREAKKQRYYVGNGKVFWTDGKIVVAAKSDKKEEPKQESAPTDDLDLPF